jgi:hypothetical protein
MTLASGEPLRPMTMWSSALTVVAMHSGWRLERVASRGVRSGAECYQARETAERRDHAVGMGAAPQGRRSSGCKSRQRGLPSQRCSNAGRSQEATRRAQAPE